MNYNKLIFKEKYIVPVKRKIRVLKYRFGRKLAFLGRRLGYENIEYAVLPPAPPVNLLDKFEKHTIQVIRTAQENYFHNYSSISEGLNDRNIEDSEYIQNIEKQDIAKKAAAFLENKVKVTRGETGDTIYRLEFFTRKGER